MISQFKGLSPFERLCGSSMVPNSTWTPSLPKHDSFSDTNRNLGNAGWNGGSVVQSLTCRWLPGRRIGSSQAIGILSAYMRSVTTFERSVACGLYVRLRSIGTTPFCHVAVFPTRRMLLGEITSTVVTSLIRGSVNLKALEWGQALLIIDADLCLGRPRVDPWMTDCALRVVYHRWWDRGFYDYECSWKISLPYPCRTDDCGQISSNKMIRSSERAFVAGN